MKNLWIGPPALAFGLLNSSFVLSQELSITGGETVISDPFLIIDNLLVTNGTLQADGPVDVNALFTWSGSSSTTGSQITGPSVVNAYGGMLLQGGNYHTLNNGALGRGSRRPTAANSSAKGGKAPSRWHRCCAVPPSGGG